jgi:hypothetical protein
MCFSPGSKHSAHTSGSRNRALDDDEIHAMGNDQAKKSPACCQARLDLHAAGLATLLDSMRAVAVIASELVLSFVMILGLQRYEQRNDTQDYSNPEPDSGRSGEGEESCRAVPGFDWT